MKSDNRQEIKKFWRWLEKNDQLIRKVLEEGSDAKMKELTNYFDEKILSFGHFTWEINDGFSKPYQLVISPNREFELLQLSKKIIANAPEMDFWEFSYAKAKVKYIEPFKIYDESLDAHLINPLSWEFKNEGDTFYVYAPNLVEIDKETEHHAMDLVATAVLGEEYRILNIKNLVRVENTESGSFSSL
ncbi:hypothetical protein [Arcticibacterium luteifluviistationis]|uniref:Uncharacterized protein n=1 Tax=Arcticibacterium luteifluviistationis TaxID=1784714 RepID=A0A2Z4GDI8_9BACT|nr:hypothetical protein [Arcticibacterium luteifluviistationis]AWV99068.1 hypothetical protein DJ013_13185 [Arcticibacterium luteifluviistationis]